MILHGYKKEEYREIKPYYTIRFKKLFGCERLSEKEFVELLKNSPDKFRTKMVLRNGYSKDSPSSEVDATLCAGEGNPDWGAQKDTPYYILKINSLKELVPANLNEEM